MSTSPMLRTRLVKLPEGVRPDQLWTIREAARQIGVNWRAVENWLRRRKVNGFTAYRIEGRYYVQAGELLRWLDNHALRV